MTVAVLVTNRPEWINHGMESAHRVADDVVYRFHDTGTFAEVVNDALAEAATFAPVCLKVDDHDIYPDDHADILNQWKPGHTVWGRARRYLCDGTELKRRSSMCSSAIPTDLTLYGDETGMLWRSLWDQTILIPVITGVEKRICSADWGWNSETKYRCPHDL